jgi:hypothetical protein
VINQVIIKQLPITHYPLPITHYPLPITNAPSPPSFGSKPSDYAALLYGFSSIGLFHQAEHVDRAYEKYRHVRGLASGN